MNYRVLPKLGWKWSEVGFGAWAIGDAWGDLVSEKEAKAALHAAFDAGVNLVDTADVYGAGRSESLIGEALKERSEEIFVATKMGRGPEWEPSYEKMKAAAVIAKERLGVEALDLVQLHCIETRLLQEGEVFEHLRTLQKEGLIRAFGVSVETMDEALLCMEQEGVALLQVIFNLFRQRLVKEVLPKAKAKQVGLLARVPLASGVLTGKFAASHEFAADDHRGFNANGEQFNVGETFAGVPFGEAVKLAAEMGEMMEGELVEARLGQKALRWILDHEEITAVIPGAKSAQQVGEHVAVSEMRGLSEGLRGKLREFYGERVDGVVRGAY